MNLIASKYLKKLNLLTGNTDEKIEKIKQQIREGEQEIEDIEA